MQPGTQPTAAIVIVGNEVLSAKVRDENSPFLIERLRARGVRVVRVAVIPDEIPDLVEELRATLPRVTWAFSCGGVGPTHDDVTIEAVAAALGRPLVVDPTLEELVRQYFGGAANTYHLKMAKVPAGSELVYPPGARYPVLRTGNLWIFPGTPELVQKKFLSIEAGLGGAPFVLRRIFLRTEEGLIARILEEAEKSEPGVAIGSYPHYGEPDHDVLVTVEGIDPAAVERVVARVLAGLPAGALVRVESAGPA